MRATDEMYCLMYCYFRVLQKTVVPSRTSISSFFAGVLHYHSVVFI